MRRFCLHFTQIGLECNLKTLPISACVALIDSNVIKAYVVRTLGNLDRANSIV